MLNRTVIVPKHKQNGNATKTQAKRYCYQNTNGTVTKNALGNVTKHRMVTILEIILYGSPLRAISTHFSNEFAFSRFGNGILVMLPKKSLWLQIYNVFHYFRAQTDFWYFAKVGTLTFLPHAFGDIDGAGLAERCVWLGCWWGWGGLPRV